MDGDLSRDERAKMAAPPPVKAPGAGPVVDPAPVWTNSDVPVPADFAGRRISFTAWALAAVAGASIWVLIFKLM